MPKLTPEQLRSRLRFDFQVCQRLFGNILTGEAYRTTTNLEQRRNPVTLLDEGQFARKYRVDFHVKTLIGQGQFANTTTIGFDLDVPNYPFDEPITWLISSHVPYSPHFKSGSPVCIGEIWRAAEGHLLLGQLFIHIARLLNWDEVARGGGYQGWNGEAIAYHKRVYRGRPITENLHYPMLPTEIVYGLDSSPSFSAGTGDQLFRPLKPAQQFDRSLFTGKGGV